ncbi:hypothetical protein GGR54DRAFT_426658 [Hypoxylon sp. NC1633]|nr:hypothetical protein GGR54DRAFT_426658 [Hypoxylon sp. NC1633]
MAPHKGQAKPGGKAPSGQPKNQPKKQPSVAAVSSRPVVVPAIPLPMIPRQQGQQPHHHRRQHPTKTNTNNHPTVSSSANGLPASSLEAALADHAVHVADGARALGQAQLPAKKPESEVNGSNVEKAEHAPPALTSTTSPVATNGKHDDNSTDKNTSASVNGVNYINVYAVKDLNGTGDADVTSASANGTNQGGQGVTQDASHTQSATSPTTASQPDQQVPPFYQQHQPAPTLQQQLSADQLPDHANRPGLSPVHHHQHHPHMSNGGGVVFGAFPGSHTPSPVPPPGGFLPSPPPPVNGETHSQPNGHHHAHSRSSGFPGPINTQFHPDMMPASGIDRFGQPQPQPPFDPFSPGGHYGLSTPHSFHGSHASGEPNGVENGPMHLYPPNGIPYGGPPHPGAPFPPFVHPQPFGRYPAVDDEGLRASIMYFQDHFDSGELTDCVLELVSAKGLHHPVKITGHKLILARSPALKQHIMAARAKDLSSHTITIESDDPYLRSDAWWSAVRRLYLFPLLDPPTITDEANGLHLAGDRTDRFEFCLGYAAAGHLLSMKDVFLRGLRMAADFISWNTVEEALSFVLEGNVQRHVNYDNEQVEMEYGYGPEARFLLENILNFLINAFPPNFELDLSVVDPPKFARIPAEAGTVPPTSTNPAASIGRGMSQRNPSKPNRLSSIKFGDLPAAFPEDGAGPPRGPAQCSPVLSRILLNLPFEELRLVLTSESEGVSGWNTAQDRYHAVADVVAEREARRLRAVEAVRVGAVGDALGIQLRLSAQRRHAIVEPWDVLNWQEEVVRPRGAEVPVIVRRWDPQFSGPSEALQQQLQPQLSDSRGSMV